jgi:hypothetical protein
MRLATVTTDMNSRYTQVSATSTTSEAYLRYAAWSDPSTSASSRWPAPSWRG